MTRAVLVAALAAAVALLPAPAPGCALVTPAGGSAAGVGEVAVVIWDEAAGVEHFTRAALFHGSTAGLGFLVPTPGRPILADARGPIGDRLEALTVPKVVTQKRLARLGLGFADDRTFAAVGAALPPAPAVELVERRRVGDFDAAVLKADDPAALAGWLGANGFASRPTVATWLGGYAAGGWHLTAFKLANDPASAAGGHLKAVRMSFPTDVPYYPYDEPADAVPAARAARGFKLFVLAPWRAAALSGPARGAFPVGELRAAWAGPVDGPAVEATAVACGLPAADAATLAGRPWTLTEFDNPWHSPRTATDLYFRPSPDQSPVERPPTVVYEDLYWPYYAAAGGLLAGGPVLVWLTWRLVRRAVRSLPAAPLD